MGLTSDDIDILRASFREVSREPERVSDAFYRRLFEIAPETQPMFKADIATQGAKMMNTLGAIVARIHDLEALQPMVADLARRHVRYGVAPQHYDTVGEALMWSLERAHGPRFRPEIGAAWSKAYAALADAMVGAAYGARRRSEP